MERLRESASRDQQSADGNAQATRTWKYSRMKLAFLSLCACGVIFFVVSKLLDRERLKTPLEEPTVDGVMLSLSWPPSTYNSSSFESSSSAQRSAVRLEHPGRRYCVGDTLSVLVDMRSHAGRAKPYGGDFLQARISSPPLRASASGDVLDLLNGSYRVRFLLSWPGEVQVSVWLVHSSETVGLLQRGWTQNYNKAIHIGTFTNGKKRETSHCSLRPLLNRTLCEYRDKEAGEYFACYKPKSLPCDSLNQTKSYIPKDRSRLTKVEARLLDKKTFGKEIKNSFDPVTVHRCTDVTHGPTEKCVAAGMTSFPGGHFFENRWSSSSCRTGSFLSEDAITRCLRGKTLYLLGDSTVRQWMEYLEQNITAMKTTKRQDNFRLAVDARDNITVWWIRHFHPWVAFYQISAKEIFSVREAVDRIAAGCRQEDAVVVIGIGQHFRPYPPEVLVRRLLETRRAVRRLQTRCPWVEVLVKLENTRDLDMEAMRFSNWYGLMQNRAQRRVFGDTGVALVDAWDMTVATGNLELHPDDVVVSNSIAVALSFVCPEE